MTTPSDAAPLWAAPGASAPIDAVIEVPGSKSLTNRYLVLAALGSTPARLRRPLRARDTELMATALSSLGTDVTVDGDDWRVTPQPWQGPVSIDCGLAGNVMRFVPAACGLARGSVTFDGDPHARTRPLAPLLDALRQLGVSVDDAARGTLPFAIEGKGFVTGGRTTIDSSASSQFITALLLAGSRYDEGLTVESIGATVPSMPHIEMTVSLLRQCSIEVHRPDRTTWQVLPAMPQVGEVVVEPDLSNALPFLAAAIVTGGRCRIPGWPEQSVQPLPAVQQLLAQLGGDLTLGTAGLEVRASGELVGADLDLSDVGELVPTVAAIATLASSPTTIRGVAHLRGHETDRLAALETEYRSLGADITQTDDGLRIIPRPLHGGVFHTYDDHRLATAAAITGLVVPGVQVENVATTAKTLPGFTELWDHMLGRAAA